MSVKLGTTTIPGILMHTVGGHPYGIDWVLYGGTGTIISVSTDGTYGSGIREFFAYENDTITVEMMGGDWYPDFINDSTGTQITTTFIQIVDTYCKLYSFTMPASNVTLNCIYDD